jgi:hypothetical protein
MLEHLRREHQELVHLADGYAEAGDDAMARFHEHDAVVLAARIETLELADGLAVGAPVDGWAA